MTVDTSFKANERYIRSFAGKVLRRARAAGLRCVDLEDIVQECAIAWMKAAESYSAEHGASFRTYLFNGMRLHINRWFDQIMKNDGQTGISLDATLFEDEVSLHEAIPSDIDVHQEVEGRQFYEKVKARLSERARIFVELLVNPPVELFQIVDARQAKAQFARSMNISTFAATNVQFSLIFDLMDAKAAERAAIRREVQLAANRVSRGEVLRWR